MSLGTVIQVVPPPPPCQQQFTSDDGHLVSFGKGHISTVAVEALKPTSRYDALSARIGIHNDILRWAAGSHIPYCMIPKCLADSNHSSWKGLAKHAPLIREALNAWPLEKMSVEYLQVEAHKPVVFQVTFSPDDTDGTLARAFFPKKTRSVIVDTVSACHYSNGG
jgi:hypothetical protein